MTAKNPKVFRCAIYTRKSTEHGLEQEFNSLHAQRESCEAYIKSQASQGWRALPQHYDDPAYSGGNLDRPALKRLLSDMDAGKVDVVVVYKIDRLTRSLADFAKLVEVFDAKAISFVAVTQQFNTTTSMGRLTLNVLLSFAQFERELSSERVRDKVAASRRKGRWMGGSVPLGYDVKDKKLVINEAEAKTVRTIFSRYLALGSFQRLVGDLDAKGIVTKRRPISNNRTVGGIPFTYGPLAYLLKNRLYVGETGHKGEWFEGDHPAVVNRDIFEKVQQLRSTNSIERTATRSSNRARLTGILFDDRGNRMTPSYSTKKGVRYHFYVSTALLRGRKAQAGSVARVSASDIEAVVDSALNKQAAVASVDGREPQQDPMGRVERITVGKGRLVITLRTDDEPAELVDSSDVTDAIRPASTFEVPWSPTKTRGLTRIHRDEGTAQEPNARLLQAIVRAHAWIRRLSDGGESIEQLARSANLNPKIVRTGIRLAFLPPRVTDSVLNGDQIAPRSIEELHSCILGRWSDQ